MNESLIDETEQTKIVVCGERIYSVPVDVAKEIERLTAERERPLLWLMSHCYAIGMKDRSDSGKPEHDIALFTIKLKERAEKAEAKLEELREDAQRLDAMEEKWMMLSWHLAGGCEVIVAGLKNLIYRGDNPLGSIRFKGANLREAIDAAIGAAVSTDQPREGE